MCESLRCKGYADGTAHDALHQPHCGNGHQTVGPAASPHQQQQDAGPGISGHPGSAMISSQKRLQSPTNKRKQLSKTKHFMHPTSAAQAPRFYDARPAPCAPLPLKDPPMADIHIHRPHQLGLPEARKIALRWAEKAEQKFDMACAYEEGETQDTVHFSRAGIKGTLQVHADQFTFAAELGFLFGAFKHRIEAELGAQFDALLAPGTSAQA